MANDQIFYMTFMLCSEKNKFVFEISNMFGDSGLLTNEELEYWLCFNIIERAKFNDVEYTALPMEEVISLCRIEERKKKANKNVPKKSPNK